MRGLKKLIKKHPLPAMCAAIIGRIIPGYFQYAGLVKRYGKDVSILRTAWHGTGDYYICGMYLEEYLRTNQIDDYIFLVSDMGSEAKVTELFDVYRGHIQKQRSVAALSRFSEFMQGEKPLCKTFECSDQLSFIGDNLKGYRGLNLLDFYLWYGFGFKDEPSALSPEFTLEADRIKTQMRDMGLTPGKTVLLAPYSTCSKTYLPPDSFWEHIAAHLQAAGYTVATNCFAGELPIKGTVAVSIEYPDIVPFLNGAGGFIGIRSGLCDIISRASCHKIVIHIWYSDFWPNGRSETFVGLRSMGLGCKADEFTYCGNSDDAMCEVIHLVSTWSLPEVENFEMP